MDYNIPDELLYTSEHEWIDPDTGWMGISEFAQEELGDIVYVDLPDVERKVQSMDAFMVIESVKAVSDVYSPVDGTVLEINQSVEDQPELVNESPYSDGRLVKLNIDSGLDELMSSEDYRSHIS